MDSVDPRSSPPQRKAERLLLLVFLLSLPLLNPWVRGDGVGYYAFARAPLIEHSLDFTHDYQSANSSFREPRLDENGQPRSEFRTPTGHLDNHFTVGPAILWSPFLVLTHIGVLLARTLGSPVAADGFSPPYRIAMAFATAAYAFLGLILAFRLTRQYIEERWALLSAFAIWGASSLPVYMYFNPSWSHAHSAFTVALFFWYWHQTRTARSLLQWTILGVIAALMLNVYYANAMLLASLAAEAIPQYWRILRSRSSGSSDGPQIGKLLASHLVFVAILLLGLLPTLVTRYIIYGNPIESGYTPLRNWLWSSPVFLHVLFSSNHGLLSWTPVLGFSIVGLFLFWRSEPRIGGAMLAAFLAFYLFICCYPDWAGISSYGNRFFVSLTPLFILGLAIFLQCTAQFFRSPRAALATAFALLTVLVLWNGGLIFQWGTHLIPARGPVSFSEIAHNQFLAVPHQVSASLQRYLFRRKALMQQIEQQDLQQLRENSPPP